MHTYRIEKNGSWVGNISADRIDCEKAGVGIGKPPIHFFAEDSSGGENYVAGLYPDVTVKLDGEVIYQPEAK